MSRHTPPRLATWLLERFGNGRRNESLIGDLHEQYAQGKGASWYWQQVVRALSVSLATAVRTHGLSFIAAIAVAYALTLVWLQANALYIGNAGEIHRFMAGMVDSYDTAATLTWFVGFSIRAVFYFCAGWVTVRIHRAHPWMVVAVVACVIYFFPLRWRQLVPTFGNEAHIILTLTASIGALLLGAVLSVRARRGQSLA